MTSGRSTHYTPIPRVESSIGMRTLGVRLSPDGFFTDEFTHRQKQALKWVRNINTAPLTREETYTAYCTMWRPSFEFPLPVTSFTKKECNILQKIFTGPFLAKMGISRTTSRVLIFGPYRYSGFALADTWVQQGLQHLHFLLGHLSYQDEVGNLLKINIDTLQLIIGLPDPPLSYSFSHITTLAPPSWVATSWEFLNDFQGTLKFNNPWHFPLDREGDCHLMTQVLERLIDITSPCLTRSELQKFNLCRLYLQVITLSDIATSSGTEIRSVERPVPLPEMDVNLSARAGSDIRKSDDL